MATLTITQNSPRFVHVVATKIASWKQAWTQYLVYRNTLTELSELSARDLADLGIHKSAIRRIAYEAAYGA